MTQVPNDRPPRPHSSRLSVSALRQRAARKPMTVTARKKKMKTASATPFTPSFTVDAPSFWDLRARWSRCHSLYAIIVSAVEMSTHSHLVPVEERDADEGRVDLGVRAHPEHRHERARQGRAAMTTAEPVSPPVVSFGRSWRIRRIRTYRGSVPSLITCVTRRQSKATVSAIVEALVRITDVAVPVYCPRMADVPAAQQQRNPCRGSASCRSVRIRSNSRREGTAASGWPLRTCAT